VSKINENNVDCRHNPNLFKHELEHAYRYGLKLCFCTVTLRNSTVFENHNASRPGAVFFNVGCNEQVFLNLGNKIGADPSCRFLEKRKKRTL